MTTDITVLNTDVSELNVATSIAVQTTVENVVVSLGTPDIMYENKYKDNGFRSYESEKFRVICLGRTMLFYGKEGVRVMNDICCINRQAYVIAS
jgi:hypothetical protein|tara:strand:+ start:67 stop:348 length:282 start_codon:yes stop_codon:yes gene_type:complete